MTRISQFLRLFLKDKFHTFINLIGLSFGLTCFTIIYLYLHNEYSYDKYHVNADRIYRVAQNYVTSGKPKKFAISSPALGPLLSQEYPQIEMFVRIKPMNKLLIKSGEKVFYEENLAFADSNLFKVFSYNFIAGDPENCLINPGSIVISEEISNKLFGEQDPMGQEILLENEYPLMVTGVIEDPPPNTHIPEKAFISYQTWDNDTQLKSTDWSLFEINDFTFLLFYNDFNRKAFDEKWPDFYEKYLQEDGEIYGQVYEPIFHKLTDLHYHSNLPGDYPTGNKSFLYTLLSIGIFILILAGINYTNMSTAKATQRIREAGIRKVFGADRRSLIMRFMGESTLLFTVTLIISFALVEFILEFTSFNDLIGTELSLSFIKKPVILFGVICITILFTVLASLYPAFYLSRFSPADTVNKLLKLRSNGIHTRQFLVVLQILLAIVAITFTMLMKSQIRYLVNSDPGFKKENIIYLPVTDSILAVSIPYIQEELEKFPDVLSVSSAYSYPGFPYGGLYRFEGKDGMEEHNIPVFYVNHGFLETLGLELVKGRDFSAEYGSDTSGAVIINETLCRFMNWDDPLNKRIVQLRYLDAKVIGVVRDFHFRSLHTEIEPLIIRLQGDYGGYLFIRLSGNRISEIINFLKKQYAEIVPYRPFEYFFLDDRFELMYKEDNMQLKLIGIFSVICIVIAGLGVFGLVSFSTERKTKEIGIRKVQGATVIRIVLLIIGHYLKIAAIAIVIAVPLSVWLFLIWLNEFAYKVNINIWILILSSLGAVIITLVTVLYHSFYAARLNPVGLLRYE